jgi:hypothetical protein
MQGIFCTGLSSLVHTWGLHVKGPVYISLFKPLSIAIAASFSAIFLGDPLYFGTYGFRLLNFSLNFNYSRNFESINKTNVFVLFTILLCAFLTYTFQFSNVCSVVGAVIISIGFYAVLWGKSKEESNEDFDIGRVSLPSNTKTPLLKGPNVIDM